MHNRGKPPMRQWRLRYRDHQLLPTITMKKIFFAFTIIFAVPVFAGEWALVNSSGTVVRVIVADSAAILDRDDGPWVKTKGKKVGIGWNYDGSQFSAPGSTYTVVISSVSAPPAKTSPRTKKKTRKQR